MSTDERFTPPDVLSLVRQCCGSITTDPCWHPDSFSRAALTYTKAQRGDLQPWFGRVWLNPPWSDPSKWIDLLIAHCDRARCGTANGRASLAVDGWGRFVPAPLGFALVRNDPSTAWYRRAWDTADAFVVLCERTRYYKLESGAVVQCGTPEFASILFYWGPHVARFLSVFHAAGHRGRPLPAFAGRTMNAPNLKDRLEQIATAEIAAFIASHPEIPLSEIAERVLAECSLEEEDLARTALERLTVGMLLEHASLATQAVAAPVPPKKGAKKGAKKAPKKTTIDTTATKKAPKKTAKRKAAKKAPKRKATEKAAKPKAAKKTAAPHAAPEPQVELQVANHPNPDPPSAEHGGNAWPREWPDRVAAIRAWLADTKRESFKMGELMTHFGINRPMARRAILEMDLKPVGDGRAAFYQVKQVNA